MTEPSEDRTGKKGAMYKRTRRAAAAAAPAPAPVVAAAPAPAPAEAAQNGTKNVEAKQRAALANINKAIFDSIITLVYRHINNKAQIQELTNIMKQYDGQSHPDKIAVATHPGKIRVSYYHYNSFAFFRFLTDACLGYLAECSPQIRLQCLKIVERLHGLIRHVNGGNADGHAWMARRATDPVLDAHPRKDDDHMCDEFSRNIEALENALNTRTSVPTQWKTHRVILRRRTHFSDDDRADEEDNEDEDQDTAAQFQNQAMARLSDAALEASMESSATDMVLPPAKRLKTETSTNVPPTKAHVPIASSASDAHTTAASQTEWLSPEFKGMMQLYHDAEHTDAMNAWKQTMQSLLESYPQQFPLREASFYVGAEARTPLWAPGDHALFRMDARIRIPLIETAMQKGATFHDTFIQTRTMEGVQRLMFFQGAGAAACDYTYDPTLHRVTVDVKLFPKTW